MAYSTICSSIAEFESTRWPRGGDCPTIVPAGILRIATGVIFAIFKPAARNLDSASTSETPESAGITYAVGDEPSDTNISTCGPVLETVPAVGFCTRTVSAGALGR